MKLSIIMPVYNEEKTVAEIIDRILRIKIDKELVIVDDCSTDGTREILKRIDSPFVKVRYHSENRGKGAAIRTALGEVTGEVVTIQDADLEYAPEEYPRLLSPIADGASGVVYGSRFLKGGSRSMSLFRFGNWFLTTVTNLLYGAHLTDMETCYKMFRAELIKGISLEANRFDFEPEITAKLLLQGEKILEVPISYTGRDFLEGKKITWRDGISALRCLLRCRFLRSTPNLDK